MRKELISQSRTADGGGPPSSKLGLRLIVILQKMFPVANRLHGHRKWKNCLRHENGVVGIREFRIKHLDK